MTDPFTLFDAWFAEARETEINDSNAMALATADARGRPSSRMVLLKGHGPDGFIFYTNFEGRKAGELLENPHAALLFHWKSLRRQIRIEGQVDAVDDATADAYFATRSRDSQLDVSARFEGGPVPRPPHWSGFRVTPDRIEFWQDRAHRLHERRLFERDGQTWREGLLYP
jgi:pyridoxamine 5'-phosphate oxidase